MIGCAIVTNRAAGFLHASLLTIALAFLGGGCAGDDTRDERSVGLPDIAITRRAQDGPVTLTLTGTPAELDISRHLSLRMEIIAEKAVTIHPEPYRRALAEDDQRFDYRIVQARQEEAKPTEDGKLRWTYECELEFFLPGEYELPAAQLSYVDTGGLLDADDADMNDDRAATLETLATETLPVMVHQPVDEELPAEELANLKTLSPIELPREWGSWWWFGPLIAAPLILFAVLLLRRRRSLRAQAVERIPADIWARREIAALVVEDLVARGFIKRFYYRVSDIVRGYVERRFAVLAPEMTTEEFLAATASDGRFGEHNTNELVKFLNACDLVKYAKHKPHPDESDRLIKAAGAFVERTRERVTPAGVESALRTNAQVVHTADPVQEHAA
jgi:hypothetical protein